jgi:hypothetical protein
MRFPFGLLSDPGIIRMYPRDLKVTAFPRLKRRSSRRRPGLRYGDGDR